VATRGLYYEWVRSLDRWAFAQAPPSIAPPTGVVL
jgi:hypothetical protein